MYSLAMGSTFEIRSYSGCIVNGVRFHSAERDNRRSTQNSGIMVAGVSEGGGDESNFYGVLDEVLDVQYSRRRRVFLFKCRWFDTDVTKNRIRMDLGYKSINTSQYWYTNEPFILANQAQQVYYIDDPKHGNIWKVVQVVQNKRLWDVPEIEDHANDEIETLEVPGTRGVDESIEPDDDGLCRNDVDPTIVEEQSIQPDDDGFINDDEEDVELSSD